MLVMRRKCLTLIVSRFRSAYFGLPSSADSIAQPVTHLEDGAIFYLFLVVAPFVNLGRSSYLLSPIVRLMLMLPNIGVCRQA